jgi:membrane protein implicated in regulation of membrane protease activity
MNKLPVVLMIVFVLAIVSFGTWQLFQGNLEAAFSTFPFLLIIYLFIKPRH